MSHSEHATLLRCAAAGLALLGCLTAAGCASNRDAVVATTATVIGVELSQSQATQAPQGVLGYRRAEFAYVPTNKVTDVPSSRKPKPATETTAGDTATPRLVKVADDTGRTDAVPAPAPIVSNGGARDSANVLMELKYSGIFSANGGIHQRLAVGDIAVGGAPATALFAKNDQGAVDPNAAKYLAAAQSKVQDEDTKVGQIIKCVSPGSGSVDSAKLDKIVADARTLEPRIQGSVWDQVKQKRTAVKLHEQLTFSDAVIEPMFKNLPPECR